MNTDLFKNNVTKKLFASKPPCIFLFIADFLFSSW